MKFDRGFLATVEAGVVLGMLREGNLRIGRAYTVHAKVQAFGVIVEVRKAELS